MADQAPGPIERVLIEEACRLVDRLDRIDGILSGRDRAWLTLEVDDLGAEVTVVLDKALSEGRQQQVALKTVLAELRQVRAAVSPGAGKPSGKAAAGPQGGGGVVADLTARITAARQAAGQ